MTCAGIDICDSNKSLLRLREGERYREKSSKRVDFFFNFVQGVCEPVKKFCFGRSDWTIITKLVFSEWIPFLLHINAEKISENSFINIYYAILGDKNNSSIYCRFVGDLELHFLSSDSNV